MQATACSSSTDMWLMKIHFAYVLVPSLIYILFYHKYSFVTQRLGIASRCLENKLHLCRSFVWISIINIIREMSSSLTCWYRGSLAWHMGRSWRTFRHIRDLAKFSKGRQKAVLGQRSLFSRARVRSAETPLPNQLSGGFRNLFLLSFHSNLTTSAVTRPLV